MEIWKDTEYENYEVSSTGKVRNKKTGKILTLANHHKGYFKAQMRVGEHGKRKTKSEFIHRLVAKSFIPNPNKLPQVDHLDNDKSNNHATNLEWVTGKENHRRKVADGLNKVPENAGRDKQPIAQYDLDGNLIATYTSIAEAVEKSGFRQSGISSVLKGTYKSTNGYVFKRI